MKLNHYKAFFDEATKIIDISVSNGIEASKAIEYAWYFLGQVGIKATQTQMLSLSKI